LKAPETLYPILYSNLPIKHRPLKPTQSDRFFFAIPEDREAHIDIVDWLIRYLVNPPAHDIRTHCSAFLKAARYISQEYHEEVEALIEDLGLEFMGAEKMEQTRRIIRLIPPYCSI